MAKINTRFLVNGHVESRIGGREENQDNAGFVDTAFGFLLVVCDGMGGGPGGRTASRLAVDTILSAFEGLSSETLPTDALHYAIEKANEAVYNEAAANPQLMGMGTTVVALLLTESSAIIAHVGDSRLYQLTDDATSFRTADHSHVAEMVRAGVITEEDARNHPMSNVITRVLGVRPEVEVEVDVQAYVQGDRFVLCTDGIWGAQPEGQLVSAFTTPGDISELTCRIVDEIDAAGQAEGNHHDNLTLAMVETLISSTLLDPMSEDMDQRFDALGISDLEDEFVNSEDEEALLEPNLFDNTRENSPVQEKKSQAEGPTSLAAGEIASTSDVPELPNSEDSVPVFMPDELQDDEEVDTEQLDAAISDIPPVEERTAARVDPAPSQRRRIKPSPTPAANSCQSQPPKSISHFKLSRNPWKVATILLCACFALLGASFYGYIRGVEMSSAGCESDQISLSDDAANQEDEKIADVKSRGIDAFGKSHPASKRAHRERIKSELDSLKRIKSGKVSDPLKEGRKRKREYIKEVIEPSLHSYRQDNNSEHVERILKMLRDRKAVSTDKNGNSTKECQEYIEEIKREVGSLK